MSSAQIGYPPPAKSGIPPQFLHPLCISKKGQCLGVLNKLKSGFFYLNYNYPLTRSRWWWDFTEKRLISFANDTKPCHEIGDRILRKILKNFGNSEIWERFFTGTHIAMRGSVNGWIDGWVDGWMDCWRGGWVGFSFWNCNPYPKLSLRGPASPHLHTRAQSVSFNQSHFSKEYVI